MSADRTHRLWRQAGLQVPRRRPRRRVATSRPRPLPPTAQNPDAALAWINQALDPIVNAEAAEYLVGGVTVEASVDHLNKATRGLYPYEDLDGLLELAPLAINAPTESDEYVTFPEWNEAFQEIKAGA